MHYSRDRQLCAPALHVTIFGIPKERLSFFAIFIAHASGCKKGIFEIVLVSSTAKRKRREKRIRDKRKRRTKKSCQSIGYRDKICIYLKIFGFNVFDCDNGTVIKYRLDRRRNNGSSEQIPENVHD